MPNRPKILNVDDKEINRYIRSQILSAAGYRVIDASSGREALERFAAEQPHLVLLDMHLPDIGGREVCERVKAASDQRTVVLHISAAAVSSEDRVLALEGGADGYLIEPVEPALLIAQVRSLLRLQKAEEGLRESEERFRSAFAQAAIGMVLTSLDGQIVQLNPAFRHIMHLPEGQALEDLPCIQTHPEDRERECALRRQLLSGEVSGFVTELRQICGDGQQIWVRNSVSLVRSATNVPRQVITITEDITSRKSAEEKLAHALDTERKAREALLQSNEELQQFAYAASHDLQEPLRTVTSYAQLLARRYIGQLDEQADEFLQYTVDGSIRMQRLINDLLAYSQVGRPDASPLRLTSLETLLPDTLSDLQLAMDESSAVVTHDPLPSILANTPQIAQLFQNLIGNAIKYRSEESPKVHVGVVREGNHWKFSVQDNGQGFRPDQAERIFGVFKRLHGREIPGTGIGLAICKRVVERHGGRIWATGNPGAGATFYFTLPVAEPEAGAAAGNE